MAEIKLAGKWKFSKIYKTVWEAKVSCKAKLVFAALEWYGEKKFPSHTTLANMCSLSPAGVKRGIKELQGAGLLSQETRVGQTNEYELFPEGNQAHLDLGQGDPGQKAIKIASNLGHGDLHNETLKTNETIPVADATPTIFNEFKLWFVAEYEKANPGKKYFFQGGKDARALQRLAGHYSLESLKAMLKAGWATPDRRDFSTRMVCMTISGFSSMVNQLEVGPEKPKNGIGNSTGQLALQAKWKKEQEEDEQRRKAQ